MPLYNYGAIRSITILPQTPTPLLDSWRLDAAVSVSRSHPGEVSRHPVQSGREGITDAVRIDPDTISVSGVITDTPIAFGAFLEGRERAARMYDLLQQLRDQRQALTVVGSWFPRLQNRWIKEFTATRTATTGRAIEISMTIEKLNIARTQLTSQQLDADIQLLGGVGPTTTVGEF